MRLTPHTVHAEEDKSAAEGDSAGAQNFIDLLERMTCLLSEFIFHSRTTVGLLSVPLWLALRPMDTYPTPRLWDSAS